MSELPKGLSQSLKMAVGRAGPHFTTAIRGQPSLKAEPIRPFLASLTNFATGPSSARRITWPEQVVPTSAMAHVREASGA